MPDELIVEVDKDDKRIGLRPRNDFYTGEHIHRASHLILFNLEGKMLLPKRAKSKRWYPLMYDFAVGGTVGNETYSHCMKREMMEELGISVSFRKAFKYFSLDRGKDAAWRTVFIAKTDLPIKTSDEIESATWVSQEDLKRDIEKNPGNFAPYLLIGLEKISL